MTFNKNEDAAEFKKVDSLEDRSTFSRLVPEEVEDEVLEAVEEGQAEYQKTDPYPRQGTAEDVVIDLEAALECAVESYEDEKARLREEKDAELRLSPVFIADLRQHDQNHEHTCGHCFKRKPINDFYRHKRDNVCIACLDAKAAAKSEE